LGISATGPDRHPYGFAPVGAALKMRVEDLQSKGAGWLIRLHEKGGKQHMMPCHNALAEARRGAGVRGGRLSFLHFIGSQSANLLTVTAQDASCQRPRSRFP
jgi:hypothetical protein